MRSAALAEPLTTAELGMETSAEFTPSTDTSADRTALVQPAPHVIPSTLREMVTASEALACSPELSFNSSFLLQAVRQSARPTIPPRSREVSFIVLIVKCSENRSICITKSPSWRIFDDQFLALRLSLMIKLLICRGMTVRVNQKKVADSITDQS